MKAKIKLKNFIKKFFLIDDSPAKIAGGAALGIFLGIVPGEGVMATLFLAWLFHLNRLAATAGVLAVNMWTTVLVFPAAAAVGSFLFGVSPGLLIQDFEKSYSVGWREFFDGMLFFKLLFPMMAGFAIVAGAIAFAFFLILYFMLKYKGVKFR
jgi:uncharacterized protein (DUF2062 family)